MKSDGPGNWSVLQDPMISSNEVGLWAILVLLALALLIPLRYFLRDWRRELWPRRIFWLINLLILPLSVYAAIHVASVLLEASSNVVLATRLDRLADTLFAIVVAILVVEGLYVVVWNGIARRKFGDSTPSILIGVSAFVVYLATAYIIAAGIFDIPVTGALVSSSILLGVIGLSLQSTIGDIFSGIFISIERPFRIGDWIVTEDGRLGKVLEIDWRATRLQSFNETVFVVPNSKIANSIIENRAEPTPRYGHYFYVSMAPEAPIGLTRRVLLEAVLSSPHILSDPPPNVNLAKAHQRPYQFLVYVYFENFEASWRGNADIQVRIHDYLKRAGLAVAGESQEIRHQPIAELPAEEPTVQQLLTEVHLFHSLSIDELELLAQQVRTTRHRPQDIIISEGDSGDSLLVITAGLVNVSRETKPGKRLSVGRLGMGQCVGEMSLLTGRPRSATVQAITDCEIVEIPKSAINLLLEERPDLVDELATTMSERRAAEELITDRDPEQAKRMSLQDIAKRFGKRIRVFFRD